MSNRPPGARSRTRALVMQALYQHLVTGTELTELTAQFKDRDEYRRVLSTMFDELLRACLLHLEDNQALIDNYADRPSDQLDVVERSILLVCLTELRDFTEVPYRVAINEALALAHRFGAEDGHKYVNAIVDKAALALRPAETRNRA